MTIRLIEKGVKKTYIWTEALGCGEILPPMLSSFLHHNAFSINVFIYEEDLKFLPEDSRIIPQIISNISGTLPNRAELEEESAKGHEGTASLWAHIIKHETNKKLIHLDADSIFLGDVITPLLEAGTNFAAVGSRRPYRHSMARKKIRKLHLFLTPDALNTHCFLFDPSALNLELSELKRLILAKNRTIAEKIFLPTIDFFDPIVFIIRKKGGIYYLDSDNQSRHGHYSRYGPFESKMISFSAVGTGSAIHKGKTVVASDSYRKFAIASYALYSKFLLGKDLNLEVLDSPFLVEQMQNLDMQTWELGK